VICGGESEEGAGEVEEDTDLEEAVVVVAVVLFVWLIAALSSSSQMARIASLSEMHSSSSGIPSSSR